MSVRQSQNPKKKNEKKNEIPKNTTRIPPTYYKKITFLMDRMSNSTSILGQKLEIHMKPNSNVDPQLHSLLVAIDVGPKYREETLGCDESKQASKYS